MLQQLTIENFITIRNFSIDFFSGLTVFTGESGVGKSVIFSAIYSLLGQPLSVNMIRPASDMLSCEAVFDIKTLSNFIYPELIDDERILIIRRTLSCEKKQIITINGKRITQKMLKEIGSQLAIVVSQHEQLSLLKSSQQLSLLDQLIPDLETYMFDYSQLYQEYSAIKKEVSNFAQLKADIAQQEFFEFQLKDISQHAFQPNEDIELLNKKKNIVAKQDEQKLIHNLHYSCQEAYKYLQQVDSVALKLSDNELLNKSLSAMPTIVSSVEELCFNVSQLKHSLSFESTMSVNDIESRLDLIFRYTSKYNVMTLHELCNVEKELNKKIQSLATYQDTLKKLEKKRESCKEQLLKKSAVLTNARKQISKVMSSSIEKNLGELGLPHPVFTVKFSRLEDFSATGIDDISFLISTIKGKEPEPLNTVASGGELSRLLLAFYSFLSHHTHPICFFFDEIDTGVGGLTANAMASTLSSIAKHHQLFCITHLAQIAAKANQHVCVSKRVVTDVDETELTYIKKDQIGDVIMSMIGGKKIFDSIT